MNAVPRPKKALRIALVGRRELEAGPDLAGRLTDLFDTLDRRLAGQAVGSRMSVPDAPWFGPGRSLLTLVSGLAQGADQIGSALFLGGQRADGAERRLGAILPFDRETYERASPVGDIGRFERLLKACSYVIELDGDSGLDLDGDDPQGLASRVAAYRTQADVLLRHADIVIAIDDRSPGRPGGTQETIRRAVELGMPVVRVMAETGEVAVLRTLDDVEEGDRVSDWHSAIVAIVDALIAIAPHGAATHAAARHGAYASELVEEFFGERGLRARRRQSIWWWFERRFRRGAPANDDPAASPIEPYRLRASALNHHYASLYRGTFLLGYILAVAAVCLAVVSLILLLQNGDSHGPHYPVWWILIALGAGKLVAVLWIQRAARTANRQRWSEKAVDYRYLAEGLRTMAYLPATGTMRPPQPLSVPFATRVVAQSNIDRLFHALLRPIDPAALTPPEPVRNVIRPDPNTALAALSETWIGNQLAYHRRNAAAMTAMSERLERLGNALSLAVIAVVCVDVGFLVLDGLHLLSHEFSEVVRGAAPWFLFLAAILPAAVASLNGIRFQSECARLADRSERMISILEGLRERAERLRGQDRATTATAPSRKRPRLVDALRLGEDIARITLDEVADWSALYAKEMIEP